MKTRKILLGLLLFVTTIFVMVNVSAYIVDTPQPDTGPSHETAAWPNANSIYTVRTSNGTIYTLWNYGEGSRTKILRSEDGFNWSEVIQVDGLAVGSLIAVNSTDIIHLLCNNGTAGLDHVIFNPSTGSNVSITKNAISYANRIQGGRLMVNSTDGLRVNLYNESNSKVSLYFYNGSSWDSAVVPLTAGFRTTACIAENDTIYVQTVDTANLDFFCWDESNDTWATLETFNTAGAFGGRASALLMNNTTIMCVGDGVGFDSHDRFVITSPLPAVTWTKYDFLDNDESDHALWVNGSRLELIAVEDGGNVWNFSYFVDDAWTEYTSVEVNSGTIPPMVFCARTARWEYDFFSGRLDGIVWIEPNDDNLKYLYYIQIFPNVAPSFLNLTIDTTYNEVYSVNIDPKDVNPQDIIVSVLQDMNAEDDWLGYSGGVLSGTVGETAYNNTTVWVEISFDDGTTNFTFNFTFDSERVQMLYTTSLPHGYLNIHYRGTVSVVNNTTWYVVTNAGWANVDNTTGEITGYPLSLGSFWFHIYVNDTNSNNTDSGNFTIVIGISPGDTASRITYILIPILIAIVGLVITVAVLYSIFGSLGSTFNKFGKS